MSQPIHQTVEFSVGPHEVYEALMDSRKHAHFTGNPARISRQVGEEFMAYDGYITGRNLELTPDRKIVQEWHASDWPEDVFSQVTFELTPIPEGTRLEFTHEKLPAGTEEEFKQGWIENYWEPMKKMLEK
jgi:activator of HSP90 ATPase